MLYNLSKPKHKKSQIHSITAQFLALLLSIYTAKTYILSAGKHTNTTGKQLLYLSPVSQAALFSEDNLFVVLENAHKSEKYGSD